MPAHEAGGFISCGHGWSLTLCGAVVWEATQLSQVGSPLLGWELGRVCHGESGLPVEGPGPWRVGQCLPGRGMCGYLLPPFGFWDRVSALSSRHRKCRILR